MPHLPADTVSALALSVPIAGLLFMVWLVLVRPEGFIISLVEVAYIASATTLTAVVMASYVHRERQAR